MPAISTKTLYSRGAALSQRRGRPLHGRIPRLYHQHHQHQTTPPYHQHPTQYQHHHHHHHHYPHMASTTNNRANVRRGYRLVGLCVASVVPAAYWYNPEKPVTVVY
mmetsp:Transcript_593/g.1206  ORF Transcript_593/g.1206 Transcript_593/m.1206 type:complete len:106 (+) Transcript_593:175-492(+)